VFGESEVVHIPKIELHRHLEGSFHVPVLFDKVLKNNLSFPKNYGEFMEYIEFPKGAKSDFHLFLSRFYNIWYESLDDVSDVVYESVKHIAKGDRLHYLELRFNPYHYCINKGFDPVETMRVVLTAANAARKELPFEVRYLVTFNRGFQKDEEMIGLLKKFEREQLMENVVGIDLAGDEVSYPPELFSRFFDYVHAASYKATIHAGEVTPPEQIWTAVNKLHADRIGHGVSTIKDSALQEVLKKKNIALEMALTSNYQTNAWPVYETHPLRRLYDNGVPVTLNSDDPTVQGENLTDDYKKAVHYLKFTREELIQLNMNAIEASFLSKSEQAALKKSYQESIND
jgi:adenosine deaminase